MLSLCYKSKELKSTRERRTLEKKQAAARAIYIRGAHSNIGLLPRSTKPISKSAAECLVNAFAQINADQETSTCSRKHILEGQGTI